MAKLVNNRQVNVWRGSAPPPTIHHLWVKDEETVYLYDEDIQNWRPLQSSQASVEIPPLEIKATSKGVEVTQGDSKFTISTQGNSLGINTDVKDTITITSDALNSITTEGPLDWKSSKQVLVHKKILKEGVIAPGNTEGTFGTQIDTTSLSFSVPSVTVDEYGHIQNISDSTITVPAVVAQNVFDNTQVGKYPIIFAPSDATKSNTQEVYKSQDIYLKSVQDGSQIVHTLVVPNIDIQGNQIITGNITVTGSINGSFIGNVTGTATPTDHADATSKYGAAQSAVGDQPALYGHVKLQDEFNRDENGIIIPPTQESGVAASPLMVYNALQQTAQAHYIEQDNEEIEENTQPITFSNDFKEQDNKLFINWLEID